MFQYIKKSRNVSLTLGAVIGAYPTQVMKKIIITLVAIFSLSATTHCSDHLNQRNSEDTLNKLALSLLFSADINEIEQLTEIKIQSYPRDRLIATAVWFKDINILSLCKNMCPVYDAYETSENSFRDQIKKVLSALKDCPFDRFYSITSCLKNSGSVSKCTNGHELNRLLLTLKNCNARTFGSVIEWLEESGIVAKCSDVRDIINIANIFDSINSDKYFLIEELFISNKSILEEIKTADEFKNRLEKHIIYIESQEKLEKAPEWNNRLIEEFHNPNNKGYKTFFRDLQGHTRTFNMKHGMLVSDFRGQLENIISSPFERARLIFGARQLEFLGCMPFMGCITPTHKEVTDFWILKEYLNLNLARYIFSYYPLNEKEERLDLQKLADTHKINSFAEVTIHLTSRLRAD